MNIRILHDPESVYADNQVMSAKELINDFIEGLNENEENDKDTIKWLNKVSEKSAIELIGSDTLVDLELSNNTFKSDTHLSTSLGWNTIRLRSLYLSMTPTQVTVFPCPVGKSINAVFSLLVVLLTISSIQLITSHCTGFNVHVGLSATSISSPI